MCSVVVAHRLGYFMVCGIYLDQGLRPCPLHWQTDSYPLSQQESLKIHLMMSFTSLFRDKSLYFGRQIRREELASWTLVSE